VATTATRRETPSGGWGSGIGTSPSSRTSKAGGTRLFQFRAEIYNVLNTVQFIDIDRAAVFDTAGRQTKSTFGTALGINSPTAPPRIVQLSARFTF
jgi:hypothetical protein